MTPVALAGLGAAGHHTAHDGGSGGGWVVVLLIATVLSVPYAVGVGRLQRRRGRRWSRWRTASWVLGVVLLAAAVAPPLTTAVHTDLRAHMAQHLLLGMYAPLALVLAAPVTLLLAATSAPTGRRVTGVLRTRPVHVLTHPVTAGVLVSGGMYVLYLTPVHAASDRLPWVHALVAVHMVLSGTVLAWAVAGPDPAPRRAGTGVRVGALVLTAGAHAHLAKLLYARAGELPVGTSAAPLEVEAAARLMYYGGDVAELLLATALFAAWYRRTGARRRVDGPVTAGLVGAR